MRSEGRVQESRVKKNATKKGAGPGGQHASIGGQSLQAILGNHCVQMEAELQKRLANELDEAVQQLLQWAAVVQQSQYSKNKLDAGQSEVRKNQPRPQGEPSLPSS